MESGKPAQLESLSSIESMVEGRTAERDDLDFKESIGNKQTARILAAMANHRGGQVVFGIREEESRASAVAAIDLAGAPERVASIARDAIDEALLLADVTPILTEADQGVLVVRIERSDRAPHFVNGQAFTRSGPTTRPMSSTEIGALFARRGEAFISEYQIEVGGPADIVARMDSERRQKGVDKKGQIKESVHHRLVLENRGIADAREVTFRLLTNDGEEARTPHVLSDEHPIQILRGGTEVSFPAAVTMGPSRAAIVEVNWVDHNGQTQTVSQSISI